MIRIVTEKVIVREERCRKVVNINGILSYEELPKQYTDGGEGILNWNGLVQKTSSGETILCVDKIYEEDQFSKKLEYIRNAAEILARINKELKEKMRVGRVKKLL